MFAKLRDLFVSGGEKKDEVAQGLSPPQPAGVPASSPQSTRLPYVAQNIPIDQYKPMKIVVIGAGMSGLNAAIRYARIVDILALL